MHAYIYYACNYQTTWIIAESCPKMAYLLYSTDYGKIYTPLYLGTKYTANSRTLGRSQRLVKNYNSGEDH